MKHTAALLAILALSSACRSSSSHAPTPTTPSSDNAPPAVSATAERPAPAPLGLTIPAVAMGEPTQAMPPTPAGLAAATFAGGCFWCMEYAFEHVRGVREVVSGYTGGSEQHPTYSEVSGHRTSQAESIRVLYDPATVTYEQLLDVFWRRIDPIDPDQAFVDEGHQYRSVIFVQNAQERAAAERSKQAIAASGRFERPIVTTIEETPAVFWVAEDYHQNYWRTHPDEFERYHEHSGRREFLRAHWGADAPY